MSNAISKVDLLPLRVNALLRPTPTSGRPCCSQCGGLVRDLDHEFLACIACQMPHYCSKDCQKRHKPTHRTHCERYIHHRRMTRITDLLGFDGSTLALEQVEVGDELVRMGYHGDQTPNRNFYLREALKVYLSGMVNNGAIDDTIVGSPVEDRAMALMVLLGGDAQVLLDLLSFTASKNQDRDTQDSPPSAASEEKIQHPLLALHGLFDKDTNETSTTMVNMYLLASCRSLADHRRKKKSFLAYQSIVQLGVDNGVLPQKIEALHSTIASFLWGRDEYEYCECLPEEIGRILVHIEQQKKGATKFLNHVFDQEVHFSPREGPNLFTNQEAPHARWQDRAPVSNIPELWLMYQECFQSFLPDLDLNDFLGPDDNDKKQTAKKKKKD